MSEFYNERLIYAQGKVNYVPHEAHWADKPLTPNPPKNEL